MKQFIAKFEIARCDNASDLSSTAPSRCPCAIFSINGRCSEWLAALVVSESPDDAGRPRPQVHIVRAEHCDPHITAGIFIHPVDRLPG